MKVEIVYGAPCSGKSTYVQDNLDDTDICYDFDLLRKTISKSDMHSADDFFAKRILMSFREDITYFAKNGIDEIDKCYLICSYPSDSLLEQLDGADYEMHLMDVSKEECFERLENDDSRSDKDAWRKLIESWFEQHGDEPKEKRTMEQTKILERIKQGIQYRKMESLQIREDNDNKMIVEGHACTFNQPYTLYDDGEYRIDEQIDPHAFDECEMDDVIFQYNHEGRVYARTRNSTLTVEPDEIGLATHAELQGTESGRGLYEEIKGGYTDRMSFGFTVAEDIVEQKNGEDGKIYILRTITKIKHLYDVSAVSLPANDGTDISARSYATGLVDQLKAEAQEKRANIERLRTEVSELLNI